MRILKFFGKFFLIVTLLVITMWVIVLGLLQTKNGQDWVYRSVKGYFERATDTQIQVKKLHFTFPLTLDLEDVLFSKEDVPVLAIKKIEVCCTYTTLLQGRMVFSHLRADEIDVFNIPKFFGSAAKEQPASPWEMPPLPIYIKFENIDIQKVTFHSNVIQSLDLPSQIKSLLENTSFNLNGMVSNNPFKSALTAHLLLTAKNKETDAILFSLGIGTQTHQLSLSLHSNHLPFNWVNPNLSNQLKGHLALYASAPVSTWQSLAEERKDVNEPIEGHFKCVLHALHENDTDFIPTLAGKQTVLRAHYLIKSRQAIEFANLKIDNANFSLIGEGILNANQTLHHTQFQGKINELGFFQPWIEKDLQGSLNFKGHLSGDALLPHIDLHLSSPHLLIANHPFQHIRSTVQIKPKNKDVHGFVDLSFNYLDTQWKGSSPFDWKNRERLTFSQLQAAGPGSHLQGEISYSLVDRIGEGSLEAQFDQLNDFSQWMTFPMSGEGKLILQLMGVKKSNDQRKQAVTAKFIGHALKWKDWEAQHAFLDVNFDPFPDHPNRFQVQGSLNGKELKNPDYFLGQYEAQFSHQVDFAQSTLQNLSAKWEAEDIKWTTGTAAKGAGQFESADPLHTLEGKLDLFASEVEISSLNLQKLMLSTQFHPDQDLWPFQLKGQGEWKENLLFALDGHWHYQQERINIDAQHLNGQFGAYPFQLKQPLHIQYQADEIQLSDLWFQWGEGEIEGNFQLSKQRVLSQFKTNAIPSEIFHFIAPDLPLSGKATFQGQFDGSIEDLKGQLNIDVHQMQIIEEVFTKKPFINGKIILNLDREGIQLDSKLNGIGSTPLLIAGQLPFHFNLDPLSLKLHSDLPFNLDLNAEGELDPYLHLFYNDTTNLSGQAKIALNISGQLNAPQIKGHIDLINGTYESLGTGALYHNIQAHLEGEGSKIILTQLSAQDKNGQISATGVIDLDASKQFPFEFEIHPSRIFILDSDYIDISSSGKLYLTGNTKKSKLEGDLTIDQASVHLEEALPQSIKTIDIKYINTSEDDPLMRFIEKREPHFPIELNVKLNAPQNIKVEGKHLKSEWKGSLIATGTPESLQLHGDVRLIFGEYNFNGKVFNLIQGNIHFAGAIDKKTSLYIVASKEIEKITAEIIIKGPVDKPVVSFRSNPPLSQREVLSYILFNRGISDITQDQGDQLSQSFISLNSSEQTASSDDFLSRLRNNMGIDRLDFTSNDSKENKDFGLQVGKHITENILISVNQSMVSLAPIIAVEAKLHKNIKAQAEAGVGQDAPIRMSIKWKKDY